MLDCAQKYLLLLDQTNLLHVRSSIDRPLNLSQYPGRKNYFSIPEENIFARDISTVFEEIKHLSSRAPEHILPDY
jgi:hypothetical protein